MEENKFTVKDVSGVEKSKVEVEEKLLKEHEEKFESTENRCMDHSHQTGEFRNIVCQKCNQRKSDRKMSKNNKSGHKYIHEEKRTDTNQGSIWVFQVIIEDKRITKASIDKEKVIQFRDQWFEEHPNYHT